MISKEEFMSYAKKSYETRGFVKVFFEFLSLFFILFFLTFTLMNLPSIIVKMRYFWKFSYPSTQNVRSPEQVQKELENKPQNRLYIPNLNIDAPIAWNVPEENIEDELLNGVVHFNGTALPGQQGNVFITGHSSFYPWSKSEYKSVFALIDELNLQDEIYISYNNKVYNYRIVNKKVVSPDQVNVLNETSNGKKTLTLMTCVPLGTNLKRLLVIAEEF